MSNVISKYQRHKIEKLDAKQTTISIEKRHKIFIDSHGVNLSALVRDTLDNIIEQFNKPKKK